jgi:hypothetical protein
VPRRSVMSQNLQQAGDRVLAELQKRAMAGD